MFTILTGIIGLVAKGSAAKAIAGGISGMLLMAAEPAVKSFQGGFATGLGTSFEELGLVLGQLVGGFVVGYAVTYLSPTNTKPTAG